MLAAADTIIRSAVVVPEPSAPNRARLPRDAVPSQRRAALERRFVDHTDRARLVDVTQLVR